MDLLKRFWRPRNSYTSEDYAREVKRGGKAFAQEHAGDLWILQNARRVSGLPELSLGRCSDDKEFGKLIRAAVPETKTKVIADLRSRRSPPLWFEEQEIAKLVNLLDHILDHLDNSGI